MLHPSSKASPNPSSGKDDLVLPPQGTATPAGQRERERRRRRELLLAAVAFLAVLVFTSVQISQLRAGDRLFVIMFNVNFVLLVGILLVVLRNGFKLLAERRRRLLGSRLRTRLVLSFVGLSLAPCLLMFLVTTKYVQLSMDFWFKDQVETSMETALDLAKTVYEKTGESLVLRAENIRAAVLERGLPWGGRAMDALMEEKRREYNMELVGLYFADGTRGNWHGQKDSQDAWESALHQLNWELLKTQGHAYALASGKREDYIFALLAVNGGKDGYLTLARSMGDSFQSRVDRIVLGSQEYKNLRSVKRPLKLMLYSSLSVLTALIILGAVWFAFRLAKELSAPIFALASGTERISKGDLSVRLADNAHDEFAMLIRSFNRMAQDLEASRQQTTEAYSLLEAQNRETARHGKYIETVLNNIAAGVISFDANGYINTVNRAACDILAMKAGDLIGRRIEDCMPEQFGSLAKSVLYRFQGRLEGRSQHSISLTIAGEERRLLVNVVGFSTNGEYRGTVAVFEDMSEMERMQRAAAWREVARRIAHEIKNPLTPIKLSAQRLARKFGSRVDDPAFTQSTELIVRQVEHLQYMVQEFSAFAKLPEVKPMPDNLEPLLRTVADLFRNSHSGIAWELSLDAPLPELPMDKEAMNRAFMNIFTNAAEALLTADTPNPVVRVSAAYHPDMNIIRIDIADNGPGLSEEERSRLFEPYFSRKKGGTGLGLTIVRSLVAAHQGYVRALPREGGGTVITMELPLA